jgi:hypothetical protein
MKKHFLMIQTQEPSVPWQGFYPDFNFALLHQVSQIKSARRQALLFF